MVNVVRCLGRGAKNATRGVPQSNLTSAKTERFALESRKRHERIGTLQERPCADCGTLGDYAGCCTTCEGHGVFNHPYRQRFGTVEPYICNCTRCYETGYCVVCVGDGREAPLTPCKICGHVFKRAETKYRGALSTNKTEEAEYGPLCETCAHAKRAAVLNTRVCKCGKPHCYNHAEGKCTK